MNNLLSQSPQTLPGALRGFGPFGLEGKLATEAPGLFNLFISTVVGLLTVVAGIWFIFVLITGAIAWIGAGGDQGKIAEARRRK